MSMSADVLKTDIIVLPRIFIEKSRMKQSHQFFKKAYSPFIFYSKRGVFMIVTKSHTDRLWLTNLLATNCTNWHN